MRISNVFYTALYRSVGAFFGLILVTCVARAAPQTPLFITDDNGVQRYDFSTATVTTLVQDHSNPGSFTGITVGPNGNLFVASSVPAGQVFQYDPTTGAQIGPGPFVFYEGTPPTPDPHDVSGPEGLQFSPTNGSLYIADVTLSNVHHYDSSGGNLGTFVHPELVQPGDVAFDASGNLYVVSSGNAEVLKSVGGTQPLAGFVSTQSGGLTNPIALTFGPDNKLYVLDGSTSNIYRYNANGSFDEIFAALGFFQPSDLAFGPDGELYISGDDLNTGSSDIIRLTATGADDGVIVDSGLTNPHFIAFAPVPEPSSFLMGSLGALGLLALACKHRV